MITRLGRRGAVLAVLGVIWIIQGVGVAATDPPAQYLLLGGPGWWLAARAAAWVITGCVAIILAPRRQGADAWGFGALYVMVAFRFLAYSYAVWDYYDDNHGADGDLRGIIGSLAWAAIAYLIYVAAGWRENDGEGGDR